MAPKIRGDEALVRMLTEDARLAAGGTPNARQNRKKPSRGRLYRELVLEAVCSSCGEPAIVSKRVKSGWNGGWRYRKYCRRCLGMTPHTVEAPQPEPVTAEKKAPRRSGVKVFV